MNIALIMFEKNVQGFRDAWKLFFFFGFSRKSTKISGLEGGGGGKK